jgi:hypothetical protein
MVAPESLTQKSGATSRKAGCPFPILSFLHFLNILEEKHRLSEIYYANLCKIKSIIAEILQK